MKAYTLDEAAVNDLHQRAGGRLDISSHQLTKHTLNVGYLVKNQEQLKEMVGEMMPTMFGPHWMHWTNSWMRYDGSLWSGQSTCVPMLKLLQMCWVMGLADLKPSTLGQSLDVKFLSPILSQHKVSTVGSKEMATRWLQVLREGGFYTLAQSQFEEHFKQSGCSLTDIGTDEVELQSIRRIYFVWLCKFHINCAKRMNNSFVDIKGIQTCLKEGVLVSDLDISQDELDELMTR